MHFTCKFSPNCVFRILFRHSSSASKPLPFVKVFNMEEEESVKVSFKYCNSPCLNLKAPKSQSVQNVLSRIKLMAAYQHKKEEIRNSVYNSFSDLPSESSIINMNDDVDVCLIQNNKPLDNNLPNCDAWILASSLKIGDTIYEVKYNLPSVTTLTLPDSILAGCPIRPHFIFECATLHESKFIWYRLITKDEATKLKVDRDENKILIQNEEFWLKVSEDFIYVTSNDDVGRFIKVVCIPGKNGRTGLEYYVESKNVVEPWPELFPFEERQKYTKSFCDDSSIRCVSYNVLANVYVEKKKFPYASPKSRDIYYRKQILIKEILGYKSDIICLQEVQERVFEHDLVPTLKNHGYMGFYNRKGGHRHEGVATFFHSNKFKVLRNYGILLNSIVKAKDIYTDLLAKVGGNFKDMSKLLAQDTALQVLVLENINVPNNRILIANTHLYSNKDTPEVRLIQAAVCTSYIEHLIKTKNLQSIPVLFCGDFNSLPQSDTFDFMTSGIYECCSSWQNNSVTNADTILRHNLYLDSACGTPEYTNYTEEFQGCLDYIFYSKNLLLVQEVVPMPRHEDVVSQVALPNELFPSDHIPLVCTFQWKEF